MLKLKQVAWALAIGTAVILFCHYRLGLSWGTDALICIALGAVYQLDVDHTALRKLVASSEAAKRLWPYQVWIVPQWHQLLLDYGLIKGAEEFRQVWEKGLKDSRLIGFTVLQAGDLGEGELIFWDARKSFTTSVDFREDVEALEFEEPEAVKQLGLPPRHLWCFLKLGGVGGYQLGVTVPKDWWNRTCTTGGIGQLAATEHDTDVRTAETQLMVATLPWQEFECMYCHRGELDYESLKKIEKQKQLRDRKLAEYGWERKDDRGAEIRSPWHYLEHKYFRVQHRSI
jgi:hypothetical protein